MRVKVVQGRPGTSESDIVAVGVFEDGFTEGAREVDGKLSGAISGIIKSGFKGEFKKAEMIHTLGKMPAKRVLVLGLGKKKDFDIERLRKAVAMAARSAKMLEVKELATDLHSLDAQGKSVEEKAHAIAESVLLGLYVFDMYKTEDKKPLKLEAVMLLDGGNNLNVIRKGIEKAKIISDSVILTRDLVNQPASIKTPEYLANEAAKIARRAGIRIQVFDRKGIQKLGLNALLAVNAGSANEPRFVVMEYGKGQETIALVGKGITFDSGGLDLKPSQYMETMKADMAGAAVVMATIKAASELKLPVHLIGVMPFTENMPGNRAYKPGDVVKAYNGKSIEIGNTDAEGRVILSDALGYASQQYKPKYIIDLATLTGAAAVALGSVAAILGNDKGLIERAKKAGLDTYERVWELPLYDEYREAIKSEIADVKNMGTGKGYGAAGTITAASFLGKFIGKEKWLHLDIAGTAFADIEESPYIPKGGTGWGVRLLIRMLEGWKG